MQKIKGLFFIIGLLILSVQGITQSIAPASGSASAASKEEATQVNYYTGIPSISVPIYSYSHHNGLNFGISLDYYAGGVKLLEAPSTVGLGWNLSMGGSITRTVHGVPDDYFPDGYMYSPAIKTNATLPLLNYNMGCIDAEPDVFQYNFNGRGGKFYIGKDSNILQVPSSKMSIILQKRDLFEDIIEIDTTEGNAVATAAILSIVIRTEDGVRYFFEDLEYQKVIKNQCLGNYPSTFRIKYASAWYLTKILSASGKDSIKIKYEQGAYVQYYQNPQQQASIANGVTIEPDTLGDGGYNPASVIPSRNRIPIEVSLPNNKKVEFNYTDGNVAFKLFNTNERILRRIQVKDSVCRYGYLFNWDTTGIGIDTRGFLTGLDYYTSSTVRKGYSFGYNAPFFKDPSYILNSGYDIPGTNRKIYLNKQDHWGYYNGANNSLNYVPTVPGLYTGADRTPNAVAVASSLASVKDPSGSTKYYDFENNDIYPLTNTLQETVVDPVLNNNTTIYIAKALGANTYFKVHFDASYVYNPNFPIVGDANALFKVTDITGNIVYSTDTVNLKDLYYTGITTFLQKYHRLATT
jgi:hypothetical protein